MRHIPEILSPAGDTDSALAAFAAGADAVYLGLKHFSARMQAENFSMRELSRLADLAHSTGKKVYIALNTLLKPGDLATAGRLVRRAALDIAPDALIVQDLGAIAVAKQAGFAGKIFLSTLANVTHPSALFAARAAGADRIILPRELSIDELRLMDAARPDGLEFEVFVHGALCHCVSGRCWWSSYMGGKSGLRGRCVQPCRRVYAQKGREGRFFSCLDLSLDVLVKALITIPGVASWKIEGRKKGPHYVYYVTTAYRLLRDHGNDPAVKKQALEILGMALGRQVTRARFLPQKETSPAAADGQTSSGLLCGKIIRDPEGRFVVKPRYELLPLDYLRIGVEDEPWHATMSVSRRIPKGGALTLKLPQHKSPRGGTPVFLLDRREPALLEILDAWNKRLGAADAGAETEAAFTPRMPVATQGTKELDIIVYSALPKGKASGIRPGAVQGLWLSPRALEGVSRTLYSRISWWLPPVIWPDEEENWEKLIRASVRDGARHFVCNEPWQSAMFSRKDKAALCAGPLCNTTNALALQALRDMGFSSAFVSPELEGADLLSLAGQSPLPLGIVLAGYWPMGITRHSIAPLKTEEPFSSPKGESFWAKRYGQNYWLYPAWPLDIMDKRPALKKAGYSMFAILVDWPPKSLGEPKRTSRFNWDAGML